MMKGKLFGGKVSTYILIHSRLSSEASRNNRTSMTL